MHTLANSEDIDEMSNIVAFHQCLHYLLRQNQSSEKEIQFLFGIFNLWPLDIYNELFQVYCIKAEVRIH